MNYIIEELNTDKISMNDVVVIAEGSEILNKMKEVAQSSWPSIFHVQSFMGNEAPVVIWVTASAYLNRQVKNNKNTLFFLQLEAASRAMMHLIILTCANPMSDICKWICRNRPELMKKNKNNLEKDIEDPGQDGGKETLSSILNPTPNASPSGTKLMIENEMTNVEMCRSLLDSILLDAEYIVGGDHIVPSKMMSQNIEKTYQYNVPGNPQYRVVAYASSGQVPLPDYREANEFTLFPDYSYETLAKGYSVRYNIRHTNMVQITQ